MLGATTATSIVKGLMGEEKVGCSLWLRGKLEPVWENRRPAVWFKTEKNFSTDKTIPKRNELPGEARKLKHRLQNYHFFRMPPTSKPQMAVCSKSLLRQD